MQSPRAPTKTQSRYCTVLFCKKKQKQRQRKGKAKEQKQKQSKRKEVKSDHHYRSPMPYSTTNTTMATTTTTSTATVSDPPPQAAPIANTSGFTCNFSDSSKKYHALIIDSGAIIKQTSLSTFGSSSSLLNSAQSYYTVPAVLSEIRDAKSRQHLDEFQLRLQSLHDTTLQTRVPSQHALREVSEFSRKTGDYPQLSNVDLQVLALLYDLEVEASKLYRGGEMGYVRKEPKRVLGVKVQPMSGDGKREVKKNCKSGGSVATASSVADATSSGNSVSSGLSSVTGNSAAAFFRGNADGIIDASHVDLDYGDDDDNDNEGDGIIVNGMEEERDDSTVGNSKTASSSVSSAKPAIKSWAVMVNPQKASTAPLVDYSLATSKQMENKKSAEEQMAALDLDLKDNTGPPAGDAVYGQFDDASESSSVASENQDAFSVHEDSEGELDAINIANATSDDEMSDEECDVFVLEPHEAAYFKKLKEQKAAQEEQQYSVNAMEEQGVSSQKNVQNNEHDDGDDAGLESEFPSLAAAAAVPYEGSDDEELESEEIGKPDYSQQIAWQQEEEERKKKSLQPMVNGRAVKNTADKKGYNSFRRYGNVVSGSGSAMAMKQKQKQKEEEETKTNQVEELISETGNATKEDKHDTTNAETANQGYKSRILGAAGAVASSNADFPSEMTAEDDDGEGWVTCTRDIQTMKATGSLQLNSSRNNSNNHHKSAAKPKNAGPPISQRAACATTDFAMQNVILQMNLELLSVDGVRVRRLKTWVTRCGACFTIYGNGTSNSNHEDLKKGGGRLFCDKCGSNTLQRIAASVDRNTGRLKLHMKKNYRYNTRGTKFSLPKAGKGNKYEGDLLLAEDQLLYGAWNQKLRKGKSKSSGQSIFGSDLASDLGCVTDLTKRDDIKVGFGRRNPNASKFGRERRGKKKKGTKDKACGLRRY